MQAKTRTVLDDSLYGCNVFSPYLSGADNDYLWTDHLGLLDETSAIRYRLSQRRWQSSRIGFSPFEAK